MPIPYVKCKNCGELISTCIVPRKEQISSSDFESRELVCEKCNHKEVYPSISFLTAESKPFFNY